MHDDKRGSRCRLRAAADFAATFHRDPPAVHDWLTGQYLRFIRLHMDLREWLTPAEG